MDAQDMVHASPAAEHPRAASRLRSAARLCLRLAAAALVFLVVGEVLARAFGMVDRMNGYSRALYAPGPDADLPYVLRPNVQTTLFGIDVRVNAFGCRGADITLEPPPGVRRVLMLGDSVVFGMGLPEKETVTTKLGWFLNAKRRTEVVNAGVQGYDTMAEARWLESLGLRLRPTAVIVGVSLNDYERPPTVSPIGLLTRTTAGSTEPRLVDRSHLFVLLQWLDAYRRGALYFQAMENFDSDLRRAEDEAAHRARRPRWTFDGAVRNAHLAFYRDPNPPVWERMRTAWADLKRITDREGIALAAVIFPEGYQIGVKAPRLVPQERLLGVCEELGIRCLDLQPAFAAGGPELFNDTQHPNARGHTIAAMAIAPWFDRP